MSLNGSHAVGTFLSSWVVIVLRADVSDASMLLKSFPCDAMHKSTA